jgi:outer membrane murein-binding lipoprotein Lpp
MTDPHQQIADLEAEIDALSDAAEQCRKSVVVAKIATGVGVLLFGAALLSLVRVGPVAMVIGIAATLGGIAFWGSSRGSLEQISGKIRMLESQRARLIDAMDLQPVQNCY